MKTEFLNRIVLILWMVNCSSFGTLKYRTAPCFTRNEFQYFYWAHQFSKITISCFLVTKVTIWTLVTRFVDYTNLYFTLCLYVSVPKFTYTQKNDLYKQDTSYSSWVAIYILQLFTEETYDDVYGKYTSKGSNTNWCSKILQI